jgi:hypothetical protein
VIVVSPWVTLALILMIGFGLVLLVWGVFRAFPQVTRFAERTFWCPFRERNVTVGFQENAWDDRPIDVDRCSAFAPATAVECDRLCLTLAKLPTVHPS